MRLTHRGAAILAASPALAIASWLFGLPEAAVLSATALLLVLSAWIWTRLHAPTVEVHRTALPARCKANETCTIQLRTQNIGRRRSAVLLLTDRVSKYGTVPLQIAPLLTQDHNTARYTFPIRQRGVHQIDATEVQVQDPFGIVRCVRFAADRTSILILAPTWPLSPIPATATGHESAQSRSAALIAHPAEEFSGLREYLPGDDLRRIHWPTTARTGRPVMRQFDLPWQNRTTVLVDLGSPASFERTVSAAASVVELAAKEGGLIRLVTTALPHTAIPHTALPHTALPHTALPHTALLGTGFVSASDKLDLIHDALALMQPSDPSAESASLATVLQHLDTREGGQIVVCTGQLDASQLLRLERGTLAFSSRILVSVTTAPNQITAGAPNWLQVNWNHGTGLDQVWDQAIHARLATLQ
ncbi:MAG: DUF58 domain-containing protein [Actinomycetes bacterium]